MLPPADPPGAAPADLARERLLDHRTVVLGGALDDAAATRAIAELMTLDASGDDHIEVLVNSRDGSLDAALMLMDVIDLLGVPVHTTCIGRAEGPVVGVLAVASQRSAVPHARLRLTIPPAAFEGRASDVRTWADAWHERQQSFIRRVAASSRRSEEWMRTAVREGRYLDAYEALRNGLVDDVVTPHTASISSIGDRPVGFQPQRSGS